MEITRGKIAAAQKVCIYGPEGIGKSTFASQFPDPLFIDLEGSTANMDVARLPKPTSWQMLLNEIDYVKQNRPCKTLVIDTADWAEIMLSKDLCARFGWKGIEDPGYGKGYIYLAEDFGRMLDALQDVVNTGIHVVITAHAMMRKFEQPDELGAYDRWELKLQKKTAPMLKEWADMLLFANYKTMAVKANNDKNAKYKAQGGKRVMYTSHHPCWDGKNRHGLPEEMPFDYNLIASIFVNAVAHESVKESSISHLDIAENVDAGPMIYEASPNVPVTEDNVSDEYAGLPQALIDLMKENNVKEEQIRKAVAKKGYFPENMPVSDYPEDFINGVLIGAWPQILSFINEIVLPF